MSRPNLLEKLSDLESRKDYDANYGREHQKWLWEGILEIKEELKERAESGDINTRGGINDASKVAIGECEYVILVGHKNNHEFNFLSSKECRFGFVGCNIDFVKAGYDEGSLINSANESGYPLESNNPNGGAHWGSYLKGAYAQALEMAKDKGCEKCCYITIRITSTESSPFFGEDIVVRYSCGYGTVTEVQNGKSLNKYFK